MRRLIAFFMFVGALFGLKSIEVDDFSILENYEKMVMVSSVKYDDFDDYIKNGNDYYYSFKKEDANSLIKSLNKIDYSGLNFYFEKDTGFDYFCKIFNNSIKKASNNQEYNVFYGYYDGYNEFNMIDGKKINFQLVQTDTQWILGFPMILTGF